MDDGVILGIPLLITRLYQMSGVRTILSGGCTMYDDAGTGEFLVPGDEIAGEERGGGPVLVTPCCPCTTSGENVLPLCGIAFGRGIKLRRLNHVIFLVF
jgi:hypothetical protein